MVRKVGKNLWRGEIASLADKSSSISVGNGIGTVPSKERQSGQKRKDPNCFIYQVLFRGARYRSKSTLRDLSEELHIGQNQIMISVMVDTSLPDSQDLAFDWEGYLKHLHFIPSVQVGTVHFGI
jgi:hypothetical protein